MSHEFPLSSSACHYLSCLIPCNSYIHIQFYDSPCLGDLSYSQMLKTITFVSGDQNYFIYIFLFNQCYRLPVHYFLSLDYPLITSVICIILVETKSKKFNKSDRKYLHQLPIAALQIIPNLNSLTLQICKVLVGQESRYGLFGFSNLVSNEGEIRCLQGLTDTSIGEGSVSRLSYVFPVRVQFLAYY